jgi:small lipoprotein (TIGR04454 family)
VRPKAKAPIVLLALLAAAPLVACGTTVSEEDCRAIANNLRDTWKAETKDAPREGPTAEKAAGVIRSEGEKLAADFASECRTKLVGQEISGKELECLRSAKTLAELRGCSKPR